MCGRTAISRNVGYYAEKFNVQEVSEEARYFKPSQNISPGTKLPIVVANGGNGSFQLCHWGISWQSADGKTLSTINSRSETVKEKFPKSLYHKRAILISDGYFEWKKIGDKVREPYFFYNENSPMMMAAVYDESKGNNSKCFSLLTVNAGNNISFIHDRQPFLLTDATSSKWLNGSPTEIDDLLSTGIRENNEMLDAIKFHPVIDKVSNSHYQGDDCTKMKKSSALPISNFFKISPKKETVAINSPSASTTSQERDNSRVTNDIVTPTVSHIKHEPDSSIQPHDIFYPTLDSEGEASSRVPTNEVEESVTSSKRSECGHVTEYIGDLKLYYCKVCDVYTERGNEQTPVSTSSNIPAKVTTTPTGSSNSTPAKVTKTPTSTNNSTPAKATKNKAHATSSSNSTPAKNNKKRKSAENSPLPTAKITSFFTKNENV